jgi:CubicO group peptidase (beta-lactamase class C family)
MRRLWWVSSALVLVVLAIALARAGGQSLFWQRYLLALGHASSDLPSAVLEPRERIPGSYAPPAPRVQPDLENLDVQALDAAAAYAAAHASLALIVSRHSHIVYERYWGGTGFDTVVNAQSFSPLVAALTTGAAISRRKLGWADEPVGFVIAEWRGDPRGAITIRNLLQSSSGLAPPGSALWPWGVGAAELFGTDLSAHLLKQPLAGKPGLTWVPQRADPQLLALAIERATGMRYAEYVSQALWTQIDASDAWLWLDREGGEAHAACCILARQGDFIRLAELLVKDGNYRGNEVIRPGWIAQLLQPARGNPDYGAFVRLGTNSAGAEPYATTGVFVVEGEGGNRMWIVPSLQIAIVRTGRLPRRGEDWDDTRIPNLIIRAARDYIPPRPHPDTDLSKLVPQHS